MKNDSPKRMRLRFLPALIGLAALGLPGVLSAASQTIFCDGDPLIARTPQPDAHLGWSVSADGIWLAAGANQDKGTVALYRNPGTRTERMPDQEIAAGDPHIGDQFGSSVSISGDWLAVGAPLGDGRVQDSGVVYLFHLEDSTWTQRIKLEAGDAAHGAQFGFSVSLGDSRLVIGAPGDSGSGSLSGAAYVFELQNQSWNLAAKLLATDGRPFDEFGSAVALAGDEIVVGAPFADDLTALKNFGAAYVFHKTGNVTGGWFLEANGKLTAGAFRGNNILFGAAVAIQTNRIVVGAPGEDLHASDSGSAYVFERTDTGWSRTELTALNPNQGAQFGTAVLIDNLDRVLIGAPFVGNGPIRDGAAYRFEQQSSGWQQTANILRQMPGGAFGQSVASLGDRIFMGGFQYSMDATDAGAVATCPSGVPQPTSLTCVKTGPTSAEAGSLVTYMIQVTNNGEAPVTGVTLDDTTPRGLTFVSGPPCIEDLPGFPPFPAGPCSLGTIEPGIDHSRPVSVTYRVAEDDCSAPPPIKNSATVKGAGVEESTCDALPLTILRPPGPLLSCEKQGPDSAKPGDLITYDVTVSNSGCGAAKNVVFSDPAPPGLTFVSVSGPCTQLPCTLSTVGAGQTLPPVKMTFEVSAPLDCSASPTVSNVATVGDAQCTAPTRIVAPVADLAVVVSPVVPVAPVTCGTSFTFSVTASNLGPAIAKGAVVDVTAVGALSLTSSELGCALVPGPQPHLRCTGLPDLPPGGPGHSITFSAQAPACGAGCAGITINATVQSGNTCDPNQANNTVNMPIPVACSCVADLAITKIHEPAVLAPGQAMAYVLTVRNNGPCAIPGTTVTDTLPNALLNAQCVGGNASDCTFLGNNLNIAVGPLPMGGQVTYRIEGQLTSQCINMNILSNTATVSPAPGIVDPDLSNNTATDTTVPFPPGVSIQCQSVNGAFEGDFVTFTYVLSNGGPNAQADNPGAEFTDTLPAGLTLVTATATSGTVTTALNTVSWNGSIPVCGTVTIRVQATVDAGIAPTTLCNTGNVAFDANGDGANESSASDTCCVTISPGPPVMPVVPTLSGASLAALALLLAGIALLRLRRGRV